MADIERALGRPERALELVRSPEAKELERSERVELSIVAAGARRDLGELDAAVVTLQGSDLDPAKRDPWSARLFYAYADNLLAAGRESDAVQWFAHTVDADIEVATDARRRLAELTGEDFDDSDDDFAISDVLEEEPPASAAPAAPAAPAAERPTRASTAAAVTDTSIATDEAVDTDGSLEVDTATEATAAVVEGDEARPASVLDSAAADAADAAGTVDAAESMDAVAGSEASVEAAAETDTVAVVDEADTVAVVNEADTAAPAEKVSTADAEAVDGPRAAAVVEGEADEDGDPLPPVDTWPAPEEENRSS
jgi:hypothetical protein